MRKQARGLAPKKLAWQELTQVEVGGQLLQLRRDGVLGAAEELRPVLNRVRLHDAAFQRAVRNCLDGAAGHDAKGDGVADLAVEVVDQLLAGGVLICDAGAVEGDAQCAAVHGFDVAVH